MYNIILIMKYFSFFILLATIFFSCDTDDDLKIDIQFRHFINNESLVLNDLIYTNQGGEIYSVQRLMYVISDLKLYCENGDIIYLDNFYFLNLDDINSLTINDIIVPSTCISISFTFGFSNVNNLSNVYLNSSNNFHNLMFWPDLLGGGYHYLKLEGKYYNSNQEEQFYNTHTGALNGTDYSFDYNQDISSENYNTLYIDMNINNFYNSPIYNFENFGSGIMQNESAQQLIFTNLEDVFSISVN